MEVKLKHELVNHGYRNLDLDNGSEVYCKFSHAGQEFLGVKLCRETVPYEVEYYIFFLHLPQKNLIGRTKLLNSQKFKSWIDLPEACLEWLSPQDIESICDLASHDRIEAAFEKVKDHLEAKLMEGEMEEFDPR